jgi:hypothetical protein
VKFIDLSKESVNTRAWLKANRDKLDPNVVLVENLSQFKTEPSLLLDVENPQLLFTALGYPEEKRKAFDDIHYQYLQNKAGLECYERALELNKAAVAKLLPRPDRFFPRPTGATPLLAHSKGSVWRLDVSDRERYKIGIRTAEHIWRWIKARPYGGNREWTNTPPSIAGSYRYPKIINDDLVIGCQTIPLWAVEDLAIEKGWRD